MKAFRALPRREIFTSLIAASFCLGILIYRIALTPVDAGLLFVKAFIIALGIIACRTVISLPLPRYALYNLYLLITCILGWVWAHYAVICYWGLLFLLFVSSAGIKKAQELKKSRSFLIVYIIVCTAICVFGFNSMYNGIRLIDTLRNISSSSVDKILFYDLKEMIGLERLPNEPRIEIDFSSNDLLPVTTAFQDTIPWSVYKNQPPHSYVTVIKREDKTISWFILKIDEEFQTVFIQFTTRVRDQSSYGTYRNDSLYRILKNEPDFN